MANWKIFNISAMTKSSDVNIKNIKTWKFYLKNMLIPKNWEKARIFNFYTQKYYIKEIIKNSHISLFVHYFNRN